MLEFRGHTYRTVDTHTCYEPRRFQFIRLLTTSEYEELDDEGRKLFRPLKPHDITLFETLNWE